jgi:hypothetical protein
VVAKRREISPLFYRLAAKNQQKTSTLRRTFRQMATAEVLPTLQPAKPSIWVAFLRLCAAFCTLRPAKWFGSCQVRPMFEQDFLKLGFPGFNAMQDSRSAYRYAIASNDAAAVMRTDSGEFVVQIVDESAAGWGVFCDPKVVLNEGDIVNLTTRRGKSICRVVRIDPDDDHQLVGLFRISDVMEEPKSHANGTLFVRKLSNTSSSLCLLLAFAVGMGGAVGFIKAGFFNFGKSMGAAQKARFDVTGDPAKRLQALSNNLASLDALKSRQVMKTIGLTDGQQRKIDNVLEKLVVDLATIHVDRGDIAPEAGSYMGLLMLRRAWTQVEQTMTKEQLAKWDAILDGIIPLDTHAGA